MSADAEDESPKARPARRTPLGLVGEVVDERIGKLQTGVLANRSASVAALARLRRAAGKPAGSMGDILEYTLDARFAPADPNDDAPTAAEKAIHVAMTLYAVHQQSQADRMHRPGHGLGRSTRALIPESLDPEKSTHPVLRRFQALGTSKNLDELAHHARGLVQLLRAAKIPLDYGLLADDLLRWQKPGGASAVRLRWGREFFRIP
ncbi:type I-E CRISPR-associated protein Cse2/CasB [Amycolatopsis cynarae]|uniref:Type I-E CRISPR-associated protein Cse2/CasB n=1 Tax=Amycolatopsis cynarae TaxID=2995223 RepID=A0ABY7B407_9PSEU|nr:type I-E CRISPR-associated protein Cse2/CasB [Amycolatopsis sp. HUAS 11-8]WAL65968.1 type I-E CRISPR-associated protein Cse2/CasB [Amycolatopsis sp. HUAS 11-8]